MTLRRKTLCIISATIIMSIVILYIVSRTIILQSFITLENNNTAEHVERARNVLLDSFVALDTFLFDWAAWDDTYQFIEDRNEEYIRSNLVDATFTSPRLNVMIFMNTSGEIVYSKAFDLDLGQEVPLSADFRESLADDECPLLFHPDENSSLTGILLLPENPMVVSSRPILTSEEQGPSHGVLIMGRYLSSEELFRLAEITRQSISIHRFDAKQPPDDVQTARTALSQGESVVIQTLSAASIAGYAMIKDIYGTPGLIVKVNLPRHIYEQGQISLLYFLAFLLVISLGFGTIILLALERLVLFRLADLSTNLQLIRNKNDLSMRVAVTGKDELSHVARSMNEMLISLEKSQIELQESEALYRGLVETSPDAIMVTDLAGKLTMANQRAAHLYGYETVQEMLEQDTQQMMVQEHPEIAVEEALQILEAGNVRRVECTIRKKDQTPFTAEISTSVLVDAHKHPTAFIDIVRDITARQQKEEDVRKYHEELENLIEERTSRLLAVNKRLRTDIAEHKQAFEQLQQSYEMRQVLVDALPDSYLRFQADGVVLESKTGRDAPHPLPEDLVGKRIQEIFPPEIGRQFDKAVKQALKTRQFIRIEYNFSPPEQQERHEEARIFPLTDAQLLAVIRDISEHRQIEKTFQELSTKISQFSSKSVTSKAEGKDKDQPAT